MEPTIKIVKAQEPLTSFVIEHCYKKADENNTCLSCLKSFSQSLFRVPWKSRLLYNELVQIVS